MMKSFKEEDLRDVCKVPDSQLGVPPEVMHESLHQLGYERPGTF
jgi:hypothetical protein